MLDPGAVAAASRAKVPVAKFGMAVPPVPSPVQLAPVSAYPAGIASVSVVAVDAAVSVCAGPLTLVPAVVVVIVWLVQPFVPVKV